MSDLAQALMVAIRVHAKQTDKQGEPYLLHVLRVVGAVSPEAQVVAALHDVVEDGGQGYRAVLRLGLDDDDFVALLALTRDFGAKKGHEIYESYIEHVAASGPLAREVKIADLRDNLGRIPASLKRRYEKALQTLEGASEQ